MAWVWLYNPQISPKSARDLYINDIKIVGVFAEHRLCSCSAMFFSLFQLCSMNDSSQQWLTRPVSSPKVTVNSWKIEPLLHPGKNKAQHPIHNFHHSTDGGDGWVGGWGGVQEKSSHLYSMLTHKTPNHALHRSLLGIGGRLLFSLLYEVGRWHPEVTAAQKQTGVRTSAHYYVILPLVSARWIASLIQQRTFEATYGKVFAAHLKLAHLFTSLCD